MQYLPSSSALKAFEAAGRHLSFLQAAKELNVTAGAVSRQIQSLEDFLGRRLFVRHNRRVELTPLGRDFLSEIRSPLSRAAQPMFTNRSSPRPSGTGTRPSSMPTPRSHDSDAARRARSKWQQCKSEVGG